VKVVVKTGDVLDEAVDVLICTANPLLAMSGGVNGAILARGGQDVQKELQAQFKTGGKGFVAPGTIVRTGPGPLRVKHILHAVGVDMSYNSSIELIAGLLRAGLEKAAHLGAKTVATPAIATGYGPLTMKEFAQACKSAIGQSPTGVEELRVVLRDKDDADLVGKILGLSGSS
jgi:O-acetyl-ADP-ribose deacetylase (regulator of RNase III)